VLCGKDQNKPHGPEFREIAHEIADELAFNEKFFNLSNSFPRGQRNIPRKAKIIARKGA